MKTRAIIPLLMFGFSASATASDANSLLLNFERQKEIFPQEKIHVHTDRNYYMGGDTLWLRAHVVDASTHKPTTLSHYVYIDLTAPNDSLTSRIKLRKENDCFAGYIPLPQGIAEGDYTLSAYTLLSQSLGEPYFFKKNIFIGSPFATKYTIATDYEYDAEDGTLQIHLSFSDNETGQPAQVKDFTYTLPDGSSQTLHRARATVRIPARQQTGSYLLAAFDQYRKFIRIPDLSEDFEVGFYPEGGHLIPGTACKVGFKAIGKNGLGKAISGKVITTEGLEVADFETLHAGMGFFSFVPKAGTAYSAVCTTEDGLTREFPLPSVEQHAASLHVTTSGESINIAAAGISGNCQLILHQRGNFLHSASLDTTQPNLSINRKDIPTGIVNAVLFDDGGQPLSERIFYVRQPDSRSVSLTSDKPVYADREKITLNVELSGYQLPEGNYSIAVTDSRSVRPDSTCNIASTLLLSSELKGHIENPAYYFTNVTDTKKLALEALMLTKGWRRYDVPAIVAGQYQKPSSEIEVGQEVDGFVLSKWRNRPEADALVNVIVPKYGYGNIFSTDSTGHFRCNGFDFPENTTLFIKAIDKNGKQLFPNIKIDTTGFPTPHRIIPFNFNQELNITDNLSWEKFIEQESMRFRYNGMSVVLDEVIVKGFKIRPPEDFYESISYRSFNYQYMEEEGITSVEEVLRKIARLRISPDGYITARGESVGLFIDGIFQTQGETTRQEDFYTYLDQAIPPGTIPKAIVPKLASGHTKADLGLGTSYESTLDIIERIPFDMIRRVDFIDKSQTVMLGGKRALGGAIAITTKRGNEIGSNNARSHIAITPLGYQQKAVFYAPAYDTVESRESTTPDLRNTLYWNPKVQVDAQGKSQISFYASDVPATEYDIRIEGMTAEGDIIKAEGSIRKE